MKKAARCISNFPLIATLCFDLRAEQLVKVVIVNSSINPGLELGSYAVLH